MPRDRRRNAPQIKKKLRVFCEGEKTEPLYINGYIRHFRIDNKTSVEVMNCRKNTPVELVQAAISFKNSDKSIDGDEFWVVYDRESSNRYSRDLHMQAWDNACRNNVNIALNNVCFEFWILLHFIDSSAAYHSFDDLKKNSTLFSKVEQHCGEKYDKASAILFEKIKDMIPLAQSRALKINRSGLDTAGAKCKPFDINPYTNMPTLLEAIKNFS
ncbi:RloB family protein [Sneathiella chinensis]|uniref:Abortive infection protein n=1 Tax=Sneathiella chinensis TaxID=349750 RepID=A0ABQ5U436_9PROT|nr:RloB family protein [Sneathiella chinensis]GLQ06832.1 abortive infection protein [Sneathiella chinensis]